ncbi:MAG: hypothetical protein BWK77_00705 [Verrucomicrobia bacterium A1]|nr:MAG: hypothetical protein BWK77_00705 [Verrucomicrobia bacterium A1]
MQFSNPYRIDRRPGLYVALICAGAGVAAGADGNWPRWRGPNDNAVVEQALPVAWSDTSNVVWKAALPGRGCSTPVVWDGKIVLTAPVDGRDGVLRWKTNLQDRFGPDALVWDIGTSPALTEKDVVVNVMNGTNSHLAAFDRATGVAHWSVPRNYACAFETDQGYTTPIVLPFAGRESLLVWNAEHLTVHDAADGATLWDCGGLNPEARSNWPPVSSPVILGDTVVVPYGRGKLLHGLRLAGRGDVTGKALLWSRNDTGSYVPTPLAYKGKVFLLRDRSEVDCIDPATGRTEWTGLFEKNATAFYASPVIAGGRTIRSRALCRTPARRVTSRTAWSSATCRCVP